MASKWAPEYQRHVAACLCRLPGFAARFAGLLKPQFFDAPSLGQIIEYVCDVWQQNKCLPSKASLIELTKDKDAVVRLFKETVDDVNFVADNVAEFCRMQAVKLAVIECAELANSHSTDNLVPILEKALATGQDLSNLGLMLKGLDGESVKNRAESYLSGEEDSGPRIPTGLEHLDQCMGGGLSPGELGVIAAPPKAGKSQMLVNIAIGAALRGHNVVYYSLEMSEKKILKRMDLRMAGTAAEFLRTVPEVFANTLTKNVLQRIIGDVRVKSYFTRTATASMLRSHLSTVVGEGFVPDLVVVDYGDIMKGERRIGGDLRHEIAGNFEDMRAMAGEFNCVFWSASQTNRGSVQRRVIGIEDLAEAFEKAAIADATVGWCRTPEEEIVNPQTGYSSGRLYLAALREAAHHLTIYCNVDFNRSYIETTHIEHVVEDDGKKRDKNNESKVAVQRARAAQSRGEQR